MADVPTLVDVKFAFGENTAKRIIAMNAMELAEFTSVKNKPTAWQIDMLSDVILANYYWLKLTELLLFFMQYKAGFYGEFYGSVDPQKITAALVLFKKQRFERIARYEEEIAAQRREEEAAEREGKTITYEQWKQLQHSVQKQ